MIGNWFKMGEYGGKRVWFARTSWRCYKCANVVKCQDYVLMIVVIVCHNDNRVKTSALHISQHQRDLDSTTGPGAHNHPHNMCNLELPPSRPNTLFTPAIISLPIHY